MRKMCENTRVKSTENRGRGTFATQVLVKGTMLTEANGPTFYPLNDADFIYPDLFAADLQDVKRNIEQSFSAYELSKEKSLNNLEEVTSSVDADVDADTLVWRCTRDIINGEELTKRYGVEKWKRFLKNDILGKNIWSIEKPWACDNLGLGEKYVDIL
jgi:SET domain-containing protein